jgi:hypothetical protein
VVFWPHVPRRRATRAPEQSRGEAAQCSSPQVGRPSVAYLAGPERKGPGSLSRRTHKVNTQARDSMLSGVRIARSRRTGSPLADLCEETLIFANAFDFDCDRFDRLLQTRHPGSCTATSPPLASGHRSASRTRVISAGSFAGRLDRRRRSFGTPFAGEVDTPWQYERGHRATIPVIWRRCVPSESMTHTSVRPLRLD